MKSSFLSLHFLPQGFLASVLFAVPVTPKPVLPALALPPEPPSHIFSCLIYIYLSNWCFTFFKTKLIIISSKTHSFSCLIMCHYSLIYLTLKLWHLPSSCPLSPFSSVTLLCCASSLVSLPTSPSCFPTPVTSY